MSRTTEFAVGDWVLIDPTKWGWHSNSDPYVQSWVGAIAIVVDTSDVLAPRDGHTLGRLKLRGTLFCPSGWQEEVFFVHPDSLTVIVAAKDLQDSP